MALVDAPSATITSCAGWAGSIALRMAERQRPIQASSLCDGMVNEITENGGNERRGTSVKVGRSSSRRSTQHPRQSNRARFTDRPLVFSSIVDDALRAEINKCHGLVLDVFERFIVPLEAELGMKSTHAVGKSHSAGNAKDYNHRIEAINYTLSHDDGVTNRELEAADIILVGVLPLRDTPTSTMSASSRPRWVTPSSWASV